MQKDRLDLLERPGGGSWASELLLRRLKVPPKLLTFPSRESHLPATDPVRLKHALCAGPAFPGLHGSDNRARGTAANCPWPVTLGYAASLAANGLEVPEALQLIPCDIILMDVQMPETDGYEATQAIRKQEQSSDSRGSWNPPLYIIAMTANVMQGGRKTCSAAGMDDYLSKPVQMSELQAALKRWKTVPHAATHRATTGDHDPTGRNGRPATSQARK